MDEIDPLGVGTLGPESTDSGTPRRKVSRLLLLWPLAGIIAIVTAFIAYPPLDETLIYWIGGVPCIIVALLINIAYRKAVAGSDVRSFFPRAIWLATGCLAVPLILLVNGALDRSPIERHRQVITRTILEHGRRGDGSFYYLELTSWRAGRTHEKMMVSKSWYLEAKPGDPAIVETHKGAFGIPLLVSVHRPE